MSLESVSERTKDPDKGLTPLQTAVAVATIVGSVVSAATFWVAARYYSGVIAQNQILALNASGRQIAQARIDFCFRLAEHHRQLSEKAWALHHNPEAAFPGSTAPGQRPSSWKDDAELNDEWFRADYKKGRAIGLCLTHGDGALECIEKNDADQKENPSHEMNVLKGAHQLKGGELVC
jgi:hypothetical protein